jgi:hypothetical protein
MVTKHCKGRDLQERCGAEARFGFNGQAQIRSNVDGIFYLFLVLLLLPSVVRSQETPLNPLEEAQKAKPAETVPTVQQAALSQSPGLPEEHPRLFWIIPTYKVSNSKAPVSMSSPEKFRLFVRNTTDPSTIIYAAFTAGIKQADNKLSGYGQGAEGYGKRLGAGLANATSAGFFRTFLFASLLHEDPRYFRQGSGPFTNRLEHAMIRPVVTRKDSGARTFNWSGLLGSIAASSLSNAYYPATDRGVGATFRRVATGIPISVIDNLIHEFGPDLERKFLQKD